MFLQECHWALDLGDWKLNFLVILAPIPKAFTMGFGLLLGGAPVHRVGGLGSWVCGGVEESFGH